jgi:hypothetical protein
MRGALAAVAVLLVGLAACGSSTHHTVVINRLTTPEQERADLGRALQAGAISQAEYSALMAKVGR